jgi:RhtB (resistance to homoserine/threonine) family protein
MYFFQFFTVALIHLLAVMSPGPDFAVVTQNSLSYSRSVGIWTAIGVGLGISVHVAYSLIGIGLIISQSIIIFTTIKWIGALYLIYIGYKALRTKPYVQETDLDTVESRKDISNWKAFSMGFVTNVLNPKATLFFLSLFTQVINVSTPIWIQLLYGLEMMLVTIVWFSLVALVFSHGSLKVRIRKIQHYVEWAMGGILIALGLKIALSQK